MHVQCRTNGPPIFKHCSRILRSMTLLSLLAVLGLMNTPSAIAAEPAIYTLSSETSTSLVLRNDGVLFQFGRLFTPESLDGSVTTPIQPNKVILTEVASVVTSIGEMPGMESVMAITTNGEVYAWQPNSNFNTLPMVVNDPLSGNPLAGIKEVIGIPTMLIVTQSGC